MLDDDRVTGQRIPPAVTFDVSIRGEVNLSVTDIWPDGDWPSGDITPKMVAERMGTDAWNVMDLIHDWELGDTLVIDVEGHDVMFLGRS